MRWNGMRSSSSVVSRCSIRSWWSWATTVSKTSRFDLKKRVKSFWVWAQHEDVSPVGLPLRLRYDFDVKFGLFMRSLKVTRSWPWLEFFSNVFLDQATWSFWSFHFHSVLFNFFSVSLSCWTRRPSNAGKKSPRPICEAVRDFPV